jgi:hypothetical protein
MKWSLAIETLYPSLLLMLGVGDSRPTQNSYVRHCSPTYISFLGYFGPQLGTWHIYILSLPGLYFTHIFKPNSIEEKDVLPVHLPFSSHLDAR